MGNGFTTSRANAEQSSNFEKPTNNSEVPLKRDPGPRHDLIVGGFDEHLHRPPAIREAANVYGGNTSEKQVTNAAYSPTENLNLSVSREPVSQPRDAQRLSTSHAVQTNMVEIFANGQQTSISNSERGFCEGAQRLQQNNNLNVDDIAIMSSPIDRDGSQSVEEPCCNYCGSHVWTTGKRGFRKRFPSKSWVLTYRFMAKSHKAGELKSDGSSRCALYGCVFCGEETLFNNGMLLAKHIKKKPGKDRVRGDLDLKEGPGRMVEGGYYNPYRSGVC